MANIKLKDLLNEIGVRNPWMKEQDDTPTVNIIELLYFDYTVYDRNGVFILYVYKYIELKFYAFFTTIFL